MKFKRNKKPSKYLDVTKEYKEIRKREFLHKRDAFLFKFSLYRKWMSFRKIRHDKKHHVPDIESMTEKVAIISQGTVMDIISCPPPMANLLLSKPKFVKLAKDGREVKPGWIYKNKVFYNPRDDK